MLREWGKGDVVVCTWLVCSSKRYVLWEIFFMSYVGIYWWVNGNRYEGKLKNGNQNGQGNTFLWHNDIPTPPPNNSNIFFLVILPAMCICGGGGGGGGGGGSDGDGGGGGGFIKENIYHGMKFELWGYFGKFM